MLLKRIVVCAILVLSGVVASIYGGAASRYLFFGVIYFLLLNLLYVVWVYLRFCIYQNVESKTVMKDQPVKYYFSLVNEDIITYSSVSVTFHSEYVTVGKMEAMTEYTLSPNDSVTRDTTLCCHCRGEYVVGIDHVTVKDIINLFHITYQSPSKIKIKVLPRVLHLDNLIFAANNEDDKIQKRIKLNASSIPDEEVREYRPGDSKKMIHWKASAKTDHLQVRTYIEDSKAQMKLILDLSPIQKKEKALRIEDQIIEATLATVDYYLKKHIPISIVYYYNGVNEFLVNSLSSFEEFYQRCCELCFRSSVSVYDLIRLQFATTQATQFYMIFTERITEDILKTIGQFVRMEHDVHLVEFTDEQSMYDCSTDRRIHLYTIKSDEEVKDRLGQR